LIAISPDKIVYFISCKTTGYMPPIERETIIDEGNAYGGIALTTVKDKKNGRWRLIRVTMSLDGMKEQLDKKVSFWKYLL
jgi:hypothetical protein